MECKTESIQEPLEIAKSLIDDFCWSEYDGPADFSDMRQVGVGFTTVTDDEIPIQIYINLVEFRLDRYLDNVLVDRRQYNSLEELIAEELESLDFDVLIFVSKKEIEASNLDYSCDRCIYYPEYPNHMQCRNCAKLNVEGGSLPVFDKNCGYHRGEVEGN